MTSLFKNAIANSPDRPAAPGSVYTQTLRTLAEIQSVQVEWRTWSQHPNSDYDQFCITLSRPEVARPHVVVIYRDGNPDAILLGRLESDTSDLKVGYWSLARRRCRQLVFLYRGFLGRSSPENIRLLVAEVMASLAHGEAAQAIFHYIPVDSELYSHTSAQLGFFVRDHFPQRQKHWVLQLSRSIDAFYQALPAKVRRNRRQEAARLLREHPGQVNIRCFRAASEVAEMTSILEGITRTTYHRGMGAGFIDNDETRRRMYLNAANDRLRTYVLYVSGVPWAFWVFTLYCGRLYGAFTGYTPDSAKYSAGTFLLLKTIEEATSEGITEIDFGFGDADYKRWFANREWEEASVCVFAPTLAGFHLSILRSTAIWSSSIAKAALLRVGLLSQLKKHWRDHLRLKVKRKDDRRIPETDGAGAEHESHAEAGCTNPGEPRDVRRNHAG